MIKKINGLIRRHGIPKYVENMKFMDDVDDVNAYVRGYHKHTFIQGKIEVNDTQTGNTTGNRPMPEFEYDNGIGIIKVYRFYLDDGYFENENNMRDYREFVRLIRQNIDGWMKRGLTGLIVDLRQHDGGAFHPFVAAFNHYFGGSAFGFYTNDGTTWIRSVRSNIVYEDKVMKRRGLLDGLPVAVLIGRNTISSGEFCASMFYGRNNVVFIGDRTGGKTSANQDFLIGNGKYLVLTVGLLETADGTIHYGEYIEPNIYSKVPVRTAKAILRKRT
jgi:C-terminal processing protease CtpA/Prc